MTVIVKTSGTKIFYLPRNESFSKKGLIILYLKKVGFEKNAFEVFYTTYEKFLDTYV